MVSAESSGGTDTTKLIGSIMVLVGLAFFVVVFVTVFPVLTDPARAYDRWFPDDAQADTREAQTDTSGATTVPAPIETIERGPVAGFGWESVSIATADNTLNRVRLRADETRGDAEIIEWRWEFGDGEAGMGASVVHDYPSADNYTVRLTVRDSNGDVDAVSGQVVVPGTGPAAGSIGQIDELTAIGGANGLGGLGDDITSSLEDAVGSVGEDLNSTLDTALGSIGTAARGGVVVALFGLAALAATIVGWRTAKIGVLLLTGAGDRSETIIRRLEKRRNEGADLEAVA